MDAKPGTDSLSFSPAEPAPPDRAGREGGRGVASKGGVSNGVASRDAAPLLAPHFDFESRLQAQGRFPVAGVDEAGRGPLAGPVVAAAVILDPQSIPAGLDDSKKLSAARRETLFTAIIAAARAVSWASVSPVEIDRLNILQASLLAMGRSVAGLTVAPAAILFDGNKVPTDCLKTGSAVIRGDSISLSIAAASIVAKVTRDRMMCAACRHYPAFGFSSHKGYGSARHLRAIAAHGASPLHRRSFAPLKNTL